MPFTGPLQEVWSKHDLVLYRNHRVTGDNIVIKSHCLCISARDGSYGCNACLIRNNKLSAHACVLLCRSHRTENSPGLISEIYNFIIIVIKSLFTGMLSHRKEKSQGLISDSIHP